MYLNFSCKGSKNPLRFTYLPHFEITQLLQSYYLCSAGYVCLFGHGFDYWPSNTFFDLHSIWARKIGCISMSCATPHKARRSHTTPDQAAELSRLSYWGGVSIVAVVVSSQARASVKLIARHMVVTHTAGWFMAAIKLTWIQLLPSISPGIRPLNVFAVSAPHYYWA